MFKRADNFISRVEEYTDFEELGHVNFTDLKTLIFFELKSTSVASILEGITYDKDELDDYF
jgi:hypothetical protein